MRCYKLLLAFLFLAATAKADFLDSFVIRHNGKIIPWDYDKLFAYDISLKNIQPGDTLSVEFHDDTPCMDCVSIIYLVPIRDNVTKETATTYGFGFNQSAAIDLNRFRMFNSRDSLFDLYYYEQGLYAAATHRKLVV